MHLQGLGFVSVESLYNGVIGVSIMGRRGVYVSLKIAVQSIDKYDSAAWERLLSNSPKRASFIDVSPYYGEYL